MTALEETGERRYPFASETSGAFVRIQGDQEPTVWVIGAARLTAHQARGLAEVLHQVADDVDGGIMTRDQVAADLAVSIRTVQRLVEAGELPSVITEADVDAFIERRTERRT